MVSKKRKHRHEAEDAVLTEIYRQLRTNIEFSQIDQAVKILSVTSSYPNEGKSTVSLNLAKIYADKYAKVLLIDCDLRNPSIHRYLNVSAVPGLTNLLRRYDPVMQLDLQDEIRKIKLESGRYIHLLSAGTRIPNPVEILGSHRFSSMLREAARQFDMIIIDCPPVLSVADSIPVANVSDGTLFVLSSRDTDKYEAREAVNNLKRNGANLIGTVMTKVPDLQTGSYYRYGYGNDE